MKLIRTALDTSLFPLAPLPQDTVLFDIETTGLSADTSYLYLIGAIHQTEEGPFLTQWFCDNFSEEKEVLTAWKHFLEPYRILVHYNGYGFDIPYLNKKFSRYKIRYQIEADTTIDIYKLLLPYRKALSLPDFKQKTLEVLSGFTRTDTFDGGDLIAVYAAYTGKYRLAALTGHSEEADALRNVLLLHNHDDLFGLLSLYQHTNILHVLNGSLQPKLTQTGDVLLFTYSVPLLPFFGCFPLYMPDTAENSFGKLSVTSDGTELSIKLYAGELKYFFSNYKDYTYLIYEDTAIHNSLAEYVDKDVKQKCRPATAYQKKCSTFLPLPFKKVPDFANGRFLFYREYKTLPAYLELPAPDALREFCSDYMAALFSAMPKLLLPQE
ncbi:MAG: ribonuclease H-like domain-containing protein [Lachnospiraceae bacterium]